MNDKISLLKEIGGQLQRGIVITDLFVTLYVLWLIITNTSHWIPGAIFGFTPFGVWILLKANKLFGFCLTHKLMIWHTFAVYCCCIYQAYIGFNILLYPMRWIMFKY